jgi:DNA polymerase III delta prime subunit
VASAVQTLSRGLCPWLRDEFDALEETRSRGRLGHSWIIAGPPGIGKTNLALALAERVLNPSGPLPEALGATKAAVARASLYEPADHRPDLYCIFPLEQRRSIGIDQIRDACQQLALSSLQGVAKVMIVEPAEHLTMPAANALLKTLEEPTPDTYLLLVSHQPACHHSQPLPGTFDRPTAAGSGARLVEGGRDARGRVRFVDMPEGGHTVPVAGECF